MNICIQPFKVDVNIIHPLDVGFANKVNDLHFPLPRNCSIVVLHGMKMADMPNKIVIVYVIHVAPRVGQNECRTIYRTQSMNTVVNYSKVIFISYIFFNTTHQYQLSDRGRVTHIFAGKLSHYWFRWLVVAFSAPMHYLNKPMMVYC